MNLPSKMPDTAMLGELLFYLAATGFKASIKFKGEKTLCFELCHHADREPAVSLEDGYSCLAALMGTEHQRQALKLVLEECRGQVHEG